LYSSASAADDSANMATMPPPRAGRSFTMVSSLGKLYKFLQLGSGLSSGHSVC
jgi:hypothetical protein